MNSTIFESVNPATGEVFSRIPVWSDAAVERALLQTARQRHEWADTPLAQRCQLLVAVADILTQERDRLAAIMTSEMGKLTKEACGEIDKCAWVCRYYAEHAEAFLADEPIQTDAARTLIAYQPLGAILAVMPWNFPFWQVFRFAAPALAAGNVCLLKHASNVMCCSEAIEEVLSRAGAPRGVFTQLPIRSQQVARVIDDPRVAAVTLTGSETAGRAVAGRAGKALKKSVLELGGSDPFIVLADADLDLAVAKALQSRFMNAGQSCIAAKRFIVEETVADVFEDRLVAAAEALQMGDPADGATTLAPMARDNLRQELHAQVMDAVARGARLLTGGKPVAGPGSFYPPTVLADITPDMAAWREELFGPVASLFRVPDASEALKLANDSAFGLGASIWTRDQERGLALARRLESGAVFINELVKSDPRVPFGGTKLSGYGRELSRLGLLEFVNAKTIWLA